jgi:hypothetical protein
VADDVLLAVADDDDEFVGTEGDELFETVGEDGFALYFDHPLRLVLGERPETSPLACGQYDCLHVAEELLEFA